MLWIGLTGGIATGKSTVSRLLTNQGLVVIDADALAREAVKKDSEGLKSVVAAFGPGVLTNDSELDRKKLGEIVFRDPAKRAVLEGIIHPQVRAMAEKRRRELEASGHAFSFYDVPLLFEKKMKPLFDHVVLVFCSPAIQIQRLMQRDGITQEQAEVRLHAQLPIQDKVDLSDYVIRNEGSLEDLKIELNRYLQSIGYQAQT